jgi:hypothetical protein
MVVKTTKITIEAENLLVVHKGRTLVAWCRSCDAETEVMTLEGESLLQETSSLLVSDWLAAGSCIHGKPKTARLIFAWLLCTGVLTSSTLAQFQSRNSLLPNRGIEDEHD